MENRTLVIGAGIAGLVAAIELARRGHAVTVCERGAAPGGKMRELQVAGQRLDAGPTVLTLRAVFDEIFADAGASLADAVTLTPASVLARHAWSRDERLDLYADVESSATAIAAFAGAAEADRYLAFTERTRSVYRALERSFIRAPRPSPVGLVRTAGLRGLRELLGIAPFARLWPTLGRQFRDPRLQQLFARYATYSGSSPFLSPATLMLIAHVEQQGVWLVQGGMHGLAVALANLAQRCGAELRYAAPVEEILIENGRAAGGRLASGERLGARAVIAAADAAALATGEFGRAAMTAVKIAAATRSLSAMTWSMVATTAGLPLLRHTVCFSRDYAAEFAALFEQRRVPTEPTVYVCAQDRDERGHGASGPERLLCLINAPADGDRHRYTAEEVAKCEDDLFTRLRHCGVEISGSPAATTVTTPTGFAQLFPATGGALYGSAIHGWRASFRRPGARTRLPGLYLAGGSVHPGPGVPMVALSGRQAVASLLADRVLTSP